MKFALAIPAIFGLLAAAAPGTVSQCNTGSSLCCNNVGAADSAPISKLLGPLGVAVGSVTGVIGLGCTPLTLVGVGGVSCAHQAVCCTGVKFNGLVNVGCSPISL